MIIKSYKTPTGIPKVRIKLDLDDARLLRTALDGVEFLASPLHARFKASLTQKLDVALAQVRGA